MSDVEVRAATPGDRAACARLLAARRREAGLPVDEEGIVRAIELALAARSTTWLALAFKGGVAVGVLLGNPVVSVGRGGAALLVDELFVAAPHRRRGIGRALVEHVRSEARNSGMAAIELEALAEEISAPAFCRTMGFADVDRRRWQRGA